MRVLVTGGAGYLGSVMVKMLASSGNDVLVFDDLSRGHRKAVASVPIVVGNLNDPQIITDTCMSFMPEGCIHFAAHSLVGESMREPVKYVCENVAGSMNLIRALSASGCSILVFSSSAAVYGMPDNIPIHEDLPAKPINPYGLSKLLVEMALEELSRRGVLSFVSLRYFNAAGADIENDLGEDHKPETHLIPRVIAAALGKVPEAVIYGSDYPTRDGTCVRDYIHVVDLCQAHMKALEYLSSGGESTVLNLGNGNGFTVREVIDAVKKVSGRDFPVRVVARRQGDPPALVACSEKIAKKLGWKPAFAGIDEIVESAWTWHCRHPDGYGD